MQGINRKYDNHAWCKVKTTNIKNDFNFTSQNTWCWSQFQCQNDHYDYFLLNAITNENVWSGDTMFHLSKQSYVPSSPYCKICSNPHLCVDTCVTWIYYVVHKQVNLIHAVIHLGTHGHRIINGRCRKVIQQVKLLVEEEVFCTPLATMLVIVLATSKTFLFEHQLNKDGDGPIELLQGNKFTQVMDKFTTLCFPNIRNLVTLSIISLTKCMFLVFWLSNI